MATIEATLRVEAWQVKYWEDLMRMDKVDYSKYGLSKFAAPFHGKVQFPNGNYASVMVCTDTPNAGTLWAQCILFDKNGNEVDRTDVADCLVGTYVMYDKDQRYAVIVESKMVDEPGNKGGYFGDQPWMYNQLGCSRKDFVDHVRMGLENGVIRDYSYQIAEKIVDDVAQDICDSADVNKWNSCDIGLGTGRVLARAVGAEE